MYINRQMDKYIEIWSYNGILHSNKKAKSTAITKMNLTDTELFKKLDSKENILYNSIYIKFRMRQNYGERFWNSVTLGDTSMKKPSGA